MADGYRVNLVALTEAAGGVNGTIAVFGQRQVAQLPFDWSAVGDDGLAGSASGFLGAWQRGVSNLVHDGHQFSGRLAGCVVAYRKAERRNAGIIEGTGADPGLG